MVTHLDELLQRLDRCEEKCAFLAAQAKPLAERSVTFWKESYPGLDEIKGSMLIEPPVGFRIDVGMIVNEQRSILDALACVLAIRNGANDLYQDSLIRTHAPTTAARWT